LWGSKKRREADEVGNKGVTFGGNDGNAGHCKAARSKPKGKKFGESGTDLRPKGDGEGRSKKNLSSRWVKESYLIGIGGAGKIGGSWRGEKGGPVKKLKTQGLYRNGAHNRTDKIKRVAGERARTFC